MTLSQGKAIFIWGTVISTLIFLALTYDSISRIPKRTHAEELTDTEVADPTYSEQEGSLSA